MKTERYDNTYVNVYLNIKQINIKNIERKRYELIFVNDTICIFRNTFLCNDIEAEYRIIEQKCSYIKKNDTLIVTNLKPIYGDTMYINIPPQESKKCYFLTDEARKYLSGSPPLFPQYYLYGKVPNITNDTLYFSKKEKDVIVLSKYNNKTNESVYCEFKKWKGKGKIQYNQY
jgi:hypothetical protein